MKVQISSIIEGIEFQGLESTSYLDLKTREVILIGEEEIYAAESDDDILEYPDWQKEPIARAKELLEKPDQYLELPSKYDLHEYRIMEDFIYSIPIEEQRDEMLNLIKGKGAFSRFRDGLERFLLTDKWYRYRDLEIEKFAKEWCEENKIEYEDKSEN